MSDSSKTKFSNNLIALAGFITAVGGLLTVLHQTGVISFTAQKDAPSREEVYNPEKNDIKPASFNADDKKPIPSRKVEREEKYVPPEPKKVVYTEPVYNLSGNWYDTINTGRYYFSHDSSTGTLIFQEYSLMQGIWVTTAEGTGTVSGKMIQVPYYTYMGTTGVFNGTIQQDGNVVSGTANDNSTGLQTRLHLNKQ